MNSYTSLKAEIKRQINAFPIGFAFSAEQLEQTKRDWNINSNDDLIGIGGGGFIRKTDREAFKNLMHKSQQAIDDAIAADPDGSGFIRDMFSAELANHEYSYTGDLTDTLDAVGLSVDQIKADPALLNGLQLALKAYTEHPEAITGDL